MQQYACARNFFIYRGIFDLVYIDNEGGHIRINIFNTGVSVLINEWVVLY